MTLAIALEQHGVRLTAAQEQRVRHQLAGLGRRLERRPDPMATLAFTGPNGEQQIVANLRLQLGPLGPTLVSSQAALTPDRAANLAVQAVERQLERMVSGQRGEPSYGVPSRRHTGRRAVRHETAYPDEPPPDDA